ncbi:hypothetical protein BB558_000948 [Smittium angustum]|uniref:ERCC4 domain-containing protein n=1 Tax=Smittium angustum TaxID=133377 RepID=A0A2U1JCT9_SMIAN|nr:hypothetical protein BB558_000948 [Smittium angustum]
MVVLSNNSNKKNQPSQIVISLLSPIHPTKTKSADTSFVISSSPSKHSQTPPLSQKTPEKTSFSPNSSPTSSIQPYKSHFLLSYNSKTQTYNQSPPHQTIPSPLQSRSIPTEDHLTTNTNYNAPQFKSNASPFDSFISSSSNTNLVHTQHTSLSTSPLNLSSSDSDIQTDIDSDVELTTPTNINPPTLEKLDQKKNFIDNNNKYNSSQLEENHLAQSSTFYKTTNPPSPQRLIPRNEPALSISNFQSDKIIKHQPKSLESQNKSTETITLLEDTLKAKTIFSPDNLIDLETNYNKASPSLFTPKTKNYGTNSLFTKSKSFTNNSSKSKFNLVDQLINKNREIFDDSWCITDDSDSELQTKTPIIPNSARKLGKKSTSDLGKLSLGNNLDFFVSLHQNSPKNHQDQSSPDTRTKTNNSVLNSSDLDSTINLTESINLQSSNNSSPKRPRSYSSTSTNNKTTNSGINLDTYPSQQDSTLNTNITEILKTNDISNSLSVGDFQLNKLNINTLKKNEKNRNGNPLTISRSDANPNIMEVDTNPQKLKKQKNLESLNNSTNDLNSVNQSVNSGNSSKSQILLDALSKAQINYSFTQQPYEGLITWSNKPKVYYNKELSIFLPANTNNVISEKLKAAMIVFNSSDFSDAVLNTNFDLVSKIEKIYDDLYIEKLFVVVYNYSSFLRKSKSRAAKIFSQTYKNISGKERDKIQSKNLTGYPPSHPQIGKSNSEHTPKVYTENSSRYCSDEFNSNDEYLSDNSILSCSQDERNSVEFSHNGCTSSQTGSQTHGYHENTFNHSQTEKNSVSNNSDRTRKKSRVQAQKSSQRGRDNATGNNKVATHSMIQDAVLKIEYKYANTHFFFDVSDMESLSRLIIQISSNMALVPFYKHKDDLGRNVLFPNGLNIDSSTIRSGSGLKDTYTKLLEQIPKVSVAIAKSITEKYPTIESLNQAWINCKDQGYDSCNDPGELLSSVAVTSARGYGERPIGSVISRLVYNFFNSENPYLLLLESKD